MKHVKILTTILLTAGLASCVTLDKVFDDLQAITAPTTLMETPEQICQAAAQNKVAANDRYVGKRFSTTGEVRLINEGFTPSYRVLLKKGSINIHAGTENKNAVKALQVGSTTRVSGVIRHVSNDSANCSISLKNATF